MRFYEALHPTKPIALAELLGGERWSPDYFRPHYVANELILEARDDASTLGCFSERLTCGPFGSSVPANLFVNSGVPFLRMSNVRAFYLDSSGLVCLPEGEADRLQAANFAPGDLVISKTGRTGLAAVLPPGPRRYVISQDVIGVTLRSRVSPYFVVAFLNSDYGALQFRRIEKGNVQAHLDLATTRAVRVPLPDRRIQDYIGAKVDLAERCRAVASQEREKLGTELATLYEGCPHDALSSLTTMIAPAEIDGSRLDAWYHQRHFITLTDWLRRNPAFVELGKVASLSSDRWSPGAHGQSTFRYIEISNVDSSTGHVSHSEVPVKNAPSRARKLLRGFDVLASTVRPNRGAVGLVPDWLDGAVATTGFAVVRPASKTDAFFLLAVLRHPASTAQLMRCNTGSAYPAIEESVLPQIWIPGAKLETRKSLGARELRRTTLLQTAVDLVDQAKADVEALIEGTLDVKAILAGTLKPPTADDIPELAEDDA
ncbi:restriction endonuclease subunit S domain-containing protein [Amycolatopsis keratiniphila]|uniref:Type I restriction enzyme, S subunit n=1 Tax=Amycolatopsis keratiniphila subsp. keratiniphila TaxID=227715 RepID=A0A1W2LH70_9PSEU|nr:hypothetical protein [Amycolatopsis keratiniphila]ONF62209.1 hypothetical protein AVR91_0238210 [Amycolatopsis keratiniphila subsp. keratiniphila]